MGLMFLATSADNLHEMSSLIQIVFDTLFHANGLHRFEIGYDISSKLSL